MPSPWVRVRPKVILFGDSLTERSFAQGGWGALLADYYKKKLDVINRGFGGYNTRWAKYIVEDVLTDCSEKNTVLATLFFGANDAAMPSPLGTE
jgi:lysophospholipase L1-like esterase